MHVSTQIQTFNYLGAKFSILKWLLPKLPRTKSFVDLFGGSMVVLLNRDPSPIETYNDINERLVNFFRVLRDHPAELIDKLHLTPHSRYEYEHAWDTGGDDDIERARKFFVRVRQSFLATGAQQEKKGWMSATRESRCLISEATNKYLRSVENLAEIVDRLKRIQIENRSYDWVLQSYDTKQTLFYADPPYDMEQRSGKGYEHDFTEEDHHKLHDQAMNIQGMIAISGYNSKMMRHLYSKKEGWHYIIGPDRKNNRSKKDVKEVLVTNYDPLTVNRNTLFG